MELGPPLSVVMLVCRATTVCVGVEGSADEHSEHSLRAKCTPPTRMSALSRMRVSAARVSNEQPSLQPVHIPS